MLHIILAWNIFISLLIICLQSLAIIHPRFPNAKAGFKFFLSLNFLQSDKHGYKVAHGSCLHLFVQQNFAQMFKR